MDAALAQNTPARGARLLLAHCAVLEARGERPAAGERLRELIGYDLANLLVSALTPTRGPRRR
jgi:hypothetical protein